MNVCCSCASLGSGNRKGGAEGWLPCGYVSVIVGMGFHIPGDWLGLS